MMRHPLVLRLAPLALIGWAAHAAATPVYLRSDSLFPSGHYTRTLLENRTRKVQFQRWLRVETKDRAFGWIPDDHLLTPLKLVSEAEVIDPLPSRTEPYMDSIERRILAKGTRVLVLDVQGSWVRARALTGNERHDTWIPAEGLRPLLNSPVHKAFVPNETTIFVLPKEHARPMMSLRAGSFVVVNRVNTNGWFEVSTSNGTGYMRRADAWIATDLGETGARPMADLTPLRSAPLPYADLLRSLPRATNLSILSSQMLRWGQARVPEVGEVWWPISEDADEDKDSPVSERISTGELFKRKIFDMASSPAIPSLKFASAQGVFRTTDGNEWTKIASFQDKNFPIAISGSGAVFVGPFVSDDQGETFQQWIRWDALVATLRRLKHRTPGTLRLEDIHPEDPAGRRVVIKLSLGEDALIKLVTDDQGMSWRPL